MMAKVAQAAEIRLHLSVFVEVTDFAGVHCVEDWGAYRRQTRGLGLRLCCTWVRIMVEDVWLLLLVMVDTLIEGGKRDGDEQE